MATEKFYGKDGDTGTLTVGGATLPTEGFFDYVEADGGAAVDTGYVANEKTVIGFKGVYLTIANYARLFADYTDEDSVATRVILNSTNDKVLYVSCFTKAGKSLEVWKAVEGKGHIITGLLNRATNTYTINSTANSFQAETGKLTGNTIKLHGSNCKTRLYSFTVSEGGEIVHDFRPYLQKGVPGYYDVVKKEFHGKTGTVGMLTVGKSEPDHYCKYIEADSLAAVDTGYVANKNTVIGFKGAYMTKYEYGRLFADYTDEDSVSTRVILKNDDVTSLYVACYTKASSPVTFNNVVSGLGQDIAGVLDRAHETYTINGQTQTVSKETGTLTGRTIKLHGSSCKTRLYSFTVSEGGKLLHDLRPYLKDDVPGYYDKVTKKFLTGSGDSVLVAGPRVANGLVLTLW